MDEDVTTYAKHKAYATLHNAIWGTHSTIPEAPPLFIAQRRTRLIPTHTLIDLSVVYAHTCPAQHNLYPSQLDSITSSIVSTFTQLLSSIADAYRALASKRKISESIVSFLYACFSVQPLIGSFARSKDFILALASLYGPGLTSIAKSFGGSHALLAQSSGNPDDWPRIWIQTKVALIDSFHIVIATLFNDLSLQSTQVDKDHVFDTLFGLRVAHPTTPQRHFLTFPSSPTITTHTTSPTNYPPSLCHPTQPPSETRDWIS